GHGVRRTGTAWRGPGAPRRASHRPRPRWAEDHRAPGTPPREGGTDPHPRGGARKHRELSPSGSYRDRPTSAVGGHGGSARTEQHDDVAMLVGPPHLSAGGLDGRDR